MNPESEKCLKDIDRLASGAETLKQRATEELTAIDDRGQAIINLAIRRIRWDMVNLVGDSAIPGNEFLLRETICQFRLKPGRRNSLSDLDDVTLYEFCKRVCSGRYAIFDVHQWLCNDQRERGEKTLSRSATFRVAKFMREQFLRLKDQYSGTVSGPMIIFDGTEGEASQGV